MIYCEIQRVSMHTYLRDFFSHLAFLAGQGQRQSPSEPESSDNGKTCENLIKGPLNAESCQDYGKIIRF